MAKFREYLQEVASTGNKKLDLKFAFLEKLIAVFQSAKDNKDDMEFWKKKVKTSIQKDMGMSNAQADKWIKDAMGRVK